MINFESTNYNMEIIGEIQLIQYEDLESSLTSIKLDKGAPYTKHVLYSVEINNLHSGDILIVTSEHQVTNNAGINLLSGSVIVLGEFEESTTGVIICQQNGFNVDPTMHHGVNVHSRIYIVKENYEKAYINLVIHSASTAATSASKLIINTGQGHLDVLHIKQQ